MAEIALIADLNGQLQQKVELYGKILFKGSGPILNSESKETQLVLWTFNQVFLSPEKQVMSFGWKLVPWELIEESIKRLAREMTWTRFYKQNSCVEFDSTLELTIRISYVTNLTLYEISS